jgi:hypothetical protein
MALLGVGNISAFNTKGSDHRAIATAFILEGIHKGGRRADAFDTVTDGQGADLKLLAYVRLVKKRRNELIYA